ncbi:hypothetical protein [Mesorhizobium argentiipisi]|uniref:HTH cro/C1-type domain-containing protein n=1 Tax=Mesorhizobium argentiipisi TaxID=3015175 RepID=A0ABU8KCE5_9HYPH
MITQRNEIELIEYMESAAFKRRSKRLQARIAKLWKAGKKEPSFDKMAEALDLPLDVVVGGFMHSMAKAGMPVRPLGRVN